MITPPPQPAKTAADYLAMAVAPALIMGMVGTLMLFLVDAGYRGPFGAQVRWILCWFVLAAVLVSRIAIQQGSNYAALYGLLLGAATAFRLTQFLGLHLGALLLLALLWWCAGKLTWDCTLIDDDTDASGEGLLQRAALLPVRANPPADPPPAPASAGQTTATPANDAQPPHAPGLWVLYFSLGALPVFGFGQLALPADDTTVRFRAFLFLGGYLACALALLFITSFLGLRRYLRQRRLLMPAATARLWITFGSAATLAVLLGALFLPRPEAADTLAALVGRPTTTQPLDSSRTRWTGEDGEPSDRPARDNTANGPARDDQPHPGRDPIDQPVDPATDPHHEPLPERPNATRDTQPPPAPRELPSPPANLATWFRWITIAVGVLLAVVVLIRFARTWLDALQRARSSKKQPSAPPSPEPAAAPRPFAAYSNPFATHRAAQMTPAQLTTYTFDALQAWAAERGWKRRPEQTPGEFGRALAAQVPELAEELLGAVRLYQSAAYARSLPATDSLDVLQRLWSRLERISTGIDAWPHDRLTARE